MRHCMMKNGTISLQHWVVNAWYMYIAGKARERWKTSCNRNWRKNKRLFVFPAQNETRAKQQIASTAIHHWPSCFYTANQPSINNGMLRCGTHGWVHIIERLTMRLASWITVNTANCSKNISGLKTRCALTERWFLQDDIDQQCGVHYLLL